MNAFAILIHLPCNIELTSLVEEDRVGRDAHPRCATVQPQRQRELRTQGN
jgi:hypothetical protein